MGQCNAGLGYPALSLDSNTVAAGSYTSIPPNHTNQPDTPPVVSQDATQVSPAADPTYELLAVLGGPWTLFLTFKLLTDGPKRFSELRRCIPGISSKVLTERLRMLERERLVRRNCEPSVPPKVSYHATPRLQELRFILLSFNEVAARWYSGAGDEPDCNQRQA